MKRKRCVKVEPWLINCMYTSAFNNIFTELRTSQRRCSVKKGALRNFAKLTGKHLCQCLFLIKLQA